MQVAFAIRTGARAGHTAILTKPYSTIGRHAASDLRFDPERDLAVSSRHAAVVLHDGIFALRDLGSTNGTLVNGVLLSGEHVLADGDVVEFGANGPRTEVTLRFADLPLPAAPAPLVGTRRADGKVTITSGHDIMRPQLATQTLLALELRDRAARLRLVVAGLAALVTGAVGLAAWQTISDRRLDQSRSALLREVDSLGTELRAMSVSIRSMQLALDSADLETARLRREIGQAGRNPRELAVLRRRLSDAAQRQRLLASVAGLDAAAITQANRAAVTLVVADFPDGTRYAGTGFAVRSIGTTGLVVTNRHLVIGANGTAPSTIGVQFDGATEAVRGEVVAVHPSADLALVRVPVRAGMRTVHGLADGPPREGLPVAMLGFPLGLDLPMGGDWRAVGVSATTGVGTVSRVLPALLQLDAYGAPGASGSPVFDSAGDVTAVLYGADAESQGRIVFAVPARQVRELLLSAGAE